MKKIAFILCLGVVSCNFARIDIEQSRGCVEGYLNALAKNNLQLADTYYSDRYMESEPKTERLEKLTRLKELLGPVLSFSLTDSTVNESFGEPGSVELTYTVKYKRKTTVETYTVVNDEGQPKIIEQSVTGQ